MLSVFGGPCPNSNIMNDTKSWFLQPQVGSYLTRIVQKLMLKFLDSQDVLEHLVQLLFAENELRSGTRCHSGLCFAGILFAAIYCVKFCHPGTQDSLLAEAINLREATDPLFNVFLEDFPGVIS